MDAAVSGLLQPDVTARCAEPQRRVRVEREVLSLCERGAGLGRAGEV